MPKKGNKKQRIKIKNEQRTKNKNKEQTKNKEQRIKTWGGGSVNI